MNKKQSTLENENLQMKLSAVNAKQVKDKTVNDKFRLAIDATIK